MKQNPSDYLSTIAVDTSERIVDALGKENVSAIFVSGSAARNEVAWFDTGDLIEIYSDLDISVVVSNECEWETCRTRARAAAAEVLLENERMKMMRPMDIGVYTIEDLLVQPARPGTVDIAESHWLLFGEAEIPRMMDKLSRASIEKKEALYLLENRMIEKVELFRQVHDSPSPDLERYAIYVALKTCLDAAAAILIFLGLYRSDPAARFHDLREAAKSRVSGALFPHGSLEQIESSYAALQNLQQTLKTEERTYRSVWDDVEPVVLFSWRRLAARIFNVRNDSWDALVLARCRRGELLRNLRELVVLAERKGIGRARALLNGVSCARLSPVESVRLFGLVESVLGFPGAAGETKKIERVFFPYLDRLTRFFGCSEGAVFDRVKRLHGEIN